MVHSNNRKLKANNNFVYNEDKNCISLLRDHANKERILKYLKYMGDEASPQNHETRALYEEELKIQSKNNCRSLLLVVCLDRKILKVILERNRKLNRS